MAHEYDTYLAEQVLNEQQLVFSHGEQIVKKVMLTCILRMMYEFHRKQNAKKPGSIHATYLITGKKTPTSTSKQIDQQDPDGDSCMPSSPPLAVPSSSAMPQEEEPVEPIPVKSIMLVGEENLERVQVLFEHISSIHVYSLESKGLSQLQTLIACNRKVMAMHQNEDPLTEWTKYGTIQNADVRRRAARGPPPAAVAAIPPAKPVAKAQAALNAAAQKTNSEPQKVTETTKNKPMPSRTQASSIFKSFAKSATKPKNVEAAPPTTRTDSQESAGQVEEDVPMGGFSDDEGDDASLPEELAEVKVPGGKSKREREAELQAMMDQEDEEDVGMKDDEHTPAADETEEEPAEAEQEIDEREPEATTVVENGRRRGRRRVMKKKTVRDEEGYLVTKEGPVWESFSEDEEPTAKKAKTQPQSKAHTATKKSGGGKPGQGNIMSFFSKR